MNEAEILEAIRTVPDDANINVFHGTYFDRSTNGMDYICDGKELKALASVTEHQASEINDLNSQVEKWSGWFTYTAELLGVKPTLVAVAAEIARLTGERDKVNKLLSSLYRALELLPQDSMGITGSAGACWPIRDEYISAIKKALSNDAGGEGER